MNKKFEAEGKTFTDPDSEAKQQNVNFCRYWKQSWDFAGQQSIPNPASQAAGMTGDTANRYPVKWIAAAYPYKDQKNAGGEMFLDELPLLQALINSPAKNNVSGSDINNSICVSADFDVCRCFPAILVFPSIKMTIWLIM
jgi:hypothetical protein